MDIVIVNLNEPPSLLRNDLKPVRRSQLAESETDRNEIEPQRDRLARDCAATAAAFRRRRCWPIQLLLFR